MPTKEKKSGRVPLTEAQVIQAAQARMKEPLLRLTREEAEWLHRHRTLSFVHALIIAKNMVQTYPLMAEYRMDWNNQVRDWRAAPEYPFHMKEE